MKKSNKLMIFFIVIISLEIAYESNWLKDMSYELRTYYFVALLVTLISVMTNWIKGLYEKAYFDELTQAGNRTKFKKEMRKLDFKENKGLGMFLDLDNFKRINDTYGHDIGDYVLKIVVERLHKIFNKKNVYRLSGDEFFILHKSVEEKSIGGKAEETIKELKKPIDVSGVNLKVCGSIGVCPINKDINNTSEFLHRADVAMYKAKKVVRGAL